MALRELETYTRNSYNRNVNITYVYQVTVYLDEETQKKVMKRKVIGKLDPDTGKVIPTGRKKASSSSENIDSEYKTKYEDILQKMQKQEEHSKTIHTQMTAVLKSMAVRFQEISRATDKAVAEINRLIAMIG